MNQLPARCRVNKFTVCGIVIVKCAVGVASPEPWPKMNHVGGEDELPLRAKCCRASGLARCSFRATGACSDPFDSIGTEYTHDRQGRMSTSSKCSAKIQLHF